MEEQELKAWLNQFQGSPPREAWKDLATQMQRSICSLYTKAKELQGSRKKQVKNLLTLKVNIDVAIIEALQFFGRPATKVEIVSRVSEANEVPMKGSWVNSLKQFLSNTGKIKKIPGVYHSLSKV